MGPEMKIAGRISLTMWNWLKAGSVSTSMIVRMTGSHSGLAPAMTAAIAIFSTVAIPRFGSTRPIT